MAYENVNVNKLKNSLSTLNEITLNKNDLNKIASSLNASNWSENSRVRIKNALDEMNKVYDDIEKYIDKCKTAADYISQYKSLDEENKRYQSKIDSNNKQIRNAEKDSDISDLENSVSYYKNNVVANNTKKNDLKNKINGLIN